MKAIVTVGIVLSLLVSFAHAEEAIPEPTEQHEKNVEMCTENLLAIGKAIEAYQKEHGDFPAWLSDLYPKHLAEANPLQHLSEADLLLCPSDKEGGKPIYTPNTDPEMPVSYSYELNPRYREWKTEQRKVYGDAMPIVRCRHHANEDFVALNLSFSSRVYRSANTWEFQPEDMYESLEEAITTLAAGIQEHPDNENLVYVYPALVRLYMKVEREEDAENLINRYKEALKPDSIREHFVLGDMLEIMNRNEELLQLFTKLEELFPENRSVFRKLAEIHERLGNAELANEYRIKADPALALIGKPVPDFSATDLDGTPISLAQYRGKVVLLDFWAVWCGPCIAEMPTVKKVYDSYKDEGFDIIGISLDTDEQRLRDYLEENEIPWRQVFSGKGWESPVSRQYGIRAIPAPWLIDKDGTLITHQARGEKLERLVAEAVQK
ncbi:redoxin domain-containing protein [Candidatus Poribacteria bacterium]|nr:redoxin domain-containing protein [Candidatus Poribacteria bacterium]MYH81549.1 redoxin domain-containing protein [Candidatus Poribacteria bacterium]MYK93928.1 redoxin domain-containing protein [Candidatus Poribacteria bacterium]